MFMNSRGQMLSKRASPRCCQRSASAFCPSSAASWPRAQKSLAASSTWSGERRLSRFASATMPG